MGGHQLICRVGDLALHNATKLYPAMSRASRAELLRAGPGTVLEIVPVPNQFALDGADGVNVISLSYYFLLYSHHWNHAVTMRYANSAVNLTHTSVLYTGRRSCPHKRYQMG